VGIRSSTDGNLSYTAIKALKLAAELTEYMQMTIHFSVTSLKSEA